MSFTTKLGKGMGRNKDKPDSRDNVIHHFGAHLLGHDGIRRLTPTDIPLPPSVDVFAGLHLPVYDQGSLGSCTANAGVLYRRFLAQRFSNYSAPDEDLSRLFLYYQERKLYGDVNADGGATVRDVFKSLSTIGVCPASMDPYVPDTFASPLNDSAAEIAAAAPYKIGAYHRVPDVDTARSVLASGYAIELGFTLYESFERIGDDGVMPMPKAGEQVIGGHAVVLHGYDDTTMGDSQAGYFSVQNSWGEEWGDGGDFYMPYAFLENAELSQFDMWIGHLGQPLVNHDKRI